MKNTLNFKLLLLTVLIFTLSISACKKSDQAVFIDATVINGGEPAYDGCGWLIRIGDINYSPINLADKYKETELKVSIRYETLTSKYLCGIGATPIPQIKLLEIKKR
jgi:hypothetical protein